MDFRLTDEQVQLRRTVREFAEAEIAPHVMKWDEASEFPSEIIPKLAELGFLGVIFPEKYGGAGMGYLEYAIIIEELSRVDGSVGIIVASHNSLCTNHIYKFGTEEQKKKYVAPLAQGQKLGCWALTEPEAGSNAAGIRTSAKKSGSGWAINGSKVFITNGRYADIGVVMASTDATKAHHGISGFIVEKGTPGFRAGKKENKLGLRASDTSELVFSDCQVPGENLLGKEGEAFLNSLSILDGGRISIASLALGMAQGAYESSVRYAKQRFQFGKPIAEFQAIQFKLADMSIQIDAARLLVYQAAWLADRALASGESSAHFTREASMAKLYAGEVAVRVAGEAVQIHGGYGFVKDYPAEKYYRDVKLCTIGEGTSEIQRIVIARELLGEELVAPPIEDWAGRVREGDVRAISRAVSAIENRTSEAEHLLRLLFPYTGNAFSIGITGAPGTGKSTLVDRLAVYYRSQNQKVGIIAVDPSSPFTGGAILGDRIRMQGHAADSGIFIRSMATRGYLGGLAQATGDTALVLDAAGKQIILIETAGVGQAEVEIVKLAHCTLVVLMPGMGDEVQNLKAGLMEIADIFVLNKSDRDDAPRFEQQLKSILQIVPDRNGWKPPVVNTVATENKGTQELAQQIEKFRAHFENAQDQAARRREYWKEWLVRLLQRRLMERIAGASMSEADFDALAARVAAREIDPYAAVNQLLARAGLGGRGGN